MSKKLYFCNTCRCNISKIEDLLFVEESKRGFCSEKCIIEFFKPYMVSFENEEIQVRESLDIEPGEVDLHLFQDKKLFEEVLYNAQEVRVEKNDLYEEFYTHIHPIHDGMYYILVCSYYEGEPAFVFFKTITKNMDLLKFYQKGNLLISDEGIKASSEEEEDDEKLLKDISLPAEVIEQVDLKKSEYLADLLNRRSESDIPFEQYGLYDDYITLTLDEPDDEFHTEDDAGDKIYTFIKTFQKRGEDFYYVVVCLNVKIPNSEDRALLPVISFPSTDDELYKFYAIGQKKNTRVTN